MPIDPRHLLDAKRALELYLGALNPEEAAEDWYAFKRSSRRLVADALRASNFLTDIKGALQANAGHALAYRQMLAPPLSQDQLKLICPSYNKGAENQRTPVSKAVAEAVAEVILARLDCGIIKWKVGDRPKTRDEIQPVLHVAATLIASQRFATTQRSRLAYEQEKAVVDLLEENGWTRLPSKLIDTRAAVPAKSFMRKTRFATGTTAHQEVDIACGLKGTYVLAMECKVTNDETNSVKRINDVLKKATAWKEHWGNFVLTAALLQGVIAPKDVQRLSDAGVAVFWSHDLAAFGKWLNDQMR